MNKTLSLLLSSISLVCSLGHAESPYFSLKDGDGFKRFSVSAGWLHAAPQGSANPLNNSTAVKNGSYRVGDVSVSSVNSAVAQTAAGDAAKTKLATLIKSGTTMGLITNNTLTSSMSGSVTINSLENWSSPDTGLEASSVDTLGLLMNYYFTDNWSLEFKAGIPPEVDINGKGQVYAPLTGTARPKGEITGLSTFIGSIANGLINAVGDIPLDAQIPVTNLSQGGKAASVRAWLPAAEIHYQFGKSGVNKFRPYVGAGVIYGYFDKVKLNTGIESDLVSAAHRIQNILDNKAGAGLDGKISSADPRVNVKAEDSFAPIITIGATYDFNENWFAVGSISYAKMSSTTKITVTDNNTGNELVSSSTKIDIDPLITYLGLGYRF